MNRTKMVFTRAEIASEENTGAKTIRPLILTMTSTMAERKRGQSEGTAGRGSKGGMFLSQVAMENRRRAAPCTRPGA